MFDLAAVSITGFWAFLQIFARVTSVFVSAPVLGAQEVPVQVKIGLSTILSFVLLPLVRSTVSQTVPETLSPFVGNLLEQVLIGLLIGFVVSMLIMAVRMAGDVIDYQMGFTQAATFDPQFNDTISPISNLQYRYAMVLYLLLNGHWLLIAALERSFVLLPVDKFGFGALSLPAFENVSYQLMVEAIQICAPAAAVLLIVDVAFAFLNRAMPQMQVYFVGMPIKILVGLLVVLTALPLFAFLISNMVNALPGDISSILGGLHR